MPVAACSSSRMSRSVSASAKGPGRVVVVMAVAHHQRAVGALHDDEMDAVFQMRGLFFLEAFAQACRFRQIGIAVIAHEAQIGHQRRLENGNPDRTGAAC